MSIESILYWVSMFVLSFVYGSIIAASFGSGVVGFLLSIIGGGLIGYVYSSFFEDKMF